MARNHNSEWESLNAAPSNPGSGNHKLYFKDGDLHAVNNAGTERNLQKAHNWEYADATAREAATGFTSADLKKLALQLDDMSLWVLTATTPTWTQVSGSAGGGGLIYRFTSVGGQGVTVSDSTLETAFDIESYMTTYGDEYQQQGSRRIPVADRVPSVAFRFKASGRFGIADDPNQNSMLNLSLHFITDPDGTPGTYGMSLGWFLTINDWEAGTEYYHRWAAEWTMQVGMLQGAPESGDWGYYFEGEMMAWETYNSSGPRKFAIEALASNQGPIYHSFPVIEFVPRCQMSVAHEDNWMSLDYLTIEKLTMNALV